MAFQAFAIIGPRELAEFIQFLAFWAKDFEQIESGLSILVLREAIDVVCWVRPSWRSIHAILAQATED